MMGGGDGIHSAQLVADYILAISGRPLDALQVIKLCYISHGYTLALTGRPLFHDQIEAWDHGPVIPILYHALGIHGPGPLTTLQYTGGPAAGAAGQAGPLLDETSREIIDQVVSTYSNLTGDQLSAITRRDGDAWSRYYERGVPVVIPDEAVGADYGDEAPGYRQVDRHRVMAAP